MIDSTPSSTRVSRYYFRACVGVVAFILVVVVFTWVARKRVSEDIARQQNERIQKAFAEAKAGRNNVVISDPALIEMLATDPDCVENIENLHFSMTDLADPRFRLVRRLVNVSEISFYECRNVNDVVSVAGEMNAIRSLSFEVTEVSHDTLQSLGNFQSLEQVRFRQVMADETIEWLNELLPDVDVDTPYPASKEPDF